MTKFSIGLGKPAHKPRRSTPKPFEVGDWWVSKSGRNWVASHKSGHRTVSGSTKRAVLNMIRTKEG